MTGFATTLYRHALGGANSVAGGGLNKPKKLVHILYNALRLQRPARISTALRTQNYR